MFWLRIKTFFCFYYSLYKTVFWRFSPAQLTFYAESSGCYFVNIYPRSSFISYVTFLLHWGALKANLIPIQLTTIKPVLSGHSKRRPKLFFKTDYRLIQVKSIAVLSYNLSIRPLFCLVLSGRLRRVLLYCKLKVHKNFVTLN